MSYYLILVFLLKVSPLPSPLKGKLRPAFKNGVAAAGWISAASSFLQLELSPSKKKMRTRALALSIVPR